MVKDMRNVSAIFSWLFRWKKWLVCMLTSYNANSMEEVGRLRIVYASLFSICIEETLVPKKFP